MICLLTISYQKHSGEWGYLPIYFETIPTTSTHGLMQAPFAITYYGSESIKLIIINPDSTLPTTFFPKH